METSPQPAIRAAYADPRTGAGLLWDEDRVRSSADGNSYPIVRGVPNFLAGPAEVSPEFVERFDRLHRLASSLGWRKALEAVDGEVDPYLTDPRRAHYLELLPLDGARVLEIGASLGQHTLSVARRAASVHAFEISPGQTQFIFECCLHEGLSNVSVSCGGDDCRLPFATAWFDCVVLNLVFEWCGVRSPEGHAAAQRRLLSEMARVLRPGGTLWLHTKNRYALRRLLGGRDEHLGGMRFGYAFPNSLVTAYLRATRGAPALGMLHSHDVLARMIRSHGFSEVRSFWAAPEMRYPLRFVPCDTESIRAARREEGFVQGETRLTRLIMPWVPAPWIRHVMPGLAFLATRAGQSPHFNTGGPPSKPDTLTLHREILRQLPNSCERFRDPQQIALMSGTGPDAQVADAPSRSVVADRDGRTVAVLFVSNETSPGLVGRSVQKANEARAALGPDVGSVIIESIADGVARGLSFALWPFCPGLSSNRGVCYVQKRMLLPRVLSWLADVAERTATEVDEDALEGSFVRPLEKVAEDECFSADARQQAQSEIRRLRSAEWKPMALVQHGDMWLGNILLPPRAARGSRARKFVVIDWAGATLRGYPFYDLLRLGMECRLDANRLRGEVDAHCRIVGCARGDVLGYLLGALGHLGMNLEHFPRDRYARMADRLLSYAKTALPA